MWSPRKLLRTTDFVVKWLVWYELRRFNRFKRNKERFDTLLHEWAVKTKMPVPSPAYTVCESRDYPGHWHVEAIESDGAVRVAVFSGPRAAWMAGEYADWKNRTLQCS
jgi:hypothetical protein